MSVVLGDGLRGLSELPSGAVDLVLTDLPSGRTQAPFDVRVDLASFFRAALHAVAATGSIVIIADSFDFAHDVRQAGGEHFRYDLIWHKARATGFFAARHQPLRAHEFVLVFSPSWHSYYEAQMSQNHTPVHGNKKQGHHGANYGQQGQNVRKARAGATDRYPVSVLTTAVVGTTDPRRTHPQQKPLVLLEWIIRSYCPLRGLVCDPCAGSGSTLQAARNCNRRAIGWDHDPKFGLELHHARPDS